MITQAQLKEYLDYNSETGVFTWKKKSSNKSNKIKIGNIAGMEAPDGYWKITFLYRAYPAHRLAWIYMNGDIPNGFDIDHINRDRKDNRITNLRLATRSQNQHNRTKSKNNTSGYKGVTWCKKTNAWMARIGINYKLIHLGRFISAEEAYDAYKEAAKKYHKQYSSI